MLGKKIPCITTSKEKAFNLTVRLWEGLEGGVRGRGWREGLEGGAIGWGWREGLEGGARGRRGGKESDVILLQLKTYLEKNLNVLKYDTQ